MTIITQYTKTPVTRKTYWNKLWEEERKGIDDPSLQSYEAFVMVEEGMETKNLEYTNPQVTVAERSASAAFLPCHDKAHFKAEKKNICWHQY